jgi:hypothetical protein
MRWAGLTGQTAKLMRTRIDPLYKPIHWIVTGEDILVGASAADVDRLAELGRRWLEVAGIRPLDVLVSILPPGPNLAFWQLSLGARRGGVSSLMLPAAPAPADVEHLRPTALAGRPGDLALLLARLVEDGHTVPGLRTVLTAGDQLDGPTRAQLRELAGRASGGEQPEVVAAWAPPGVRALWVECRGGIALHTWPDAEALEVVDPQGAAVAAGQEGEIAWTALGWRGTVFVRLRTGARGQLDESPCPVCGRTTPRLSVRSWLPPFAAILDAEDALTGWQAELRTVVGGQELVLFVVPRDPAGDGLEPVLRELDRRLSVAQFVVLDGAALEERLAAHDGVLVVDRRSDGG